MQLQHPLLLQLLSPPLLPIGGQNLAKIDNICGAKCHIFDISGKFIGLWERYYGDADAVIYCWRLDHKEDDTPFYAEAKQREILEMVRREIPDDVPILIFGQDLEPTKEGAGRTGTSRAAASTVTHPTKVGKIGQYLQKQQREQQRHVTVPATTTLPTELFLPNYHSNLMHAMCGSAKTGQGIREAMEWLIPLAKRQAKMRAQQQQQQHEVAAAGRTPTTSRATMR